MNENANFALSHFFSFKNKSFWLNVSLGFGGLSVVVVGYGLYDDGKASSSTTYCATYAHI